MKAQDFLNDRSDYYIRLLFKSFLNILEDLQNQHEVNFEKMYNNMPDEYQKYVEMADYFDNERYQYYRKKVLDIGNSVLRDYNSEVETLKVEFKFKQ
tara:strand:- start:954 stop:1244 length:291 start_codon:yes stop_codon:yes gene_type:complete